MREQRLFASLDRPATTGGRVGLYFAVRYSTPLLVLLAVAASSTRPNADRLTALLTAQVAIVLGTHLLATRSTTALGYGVWLGMVADTAIIATLVAQTGGTGGPLVFLFTVQALAAGVLLSSSAGFRMLALGTVAILMVDILANQGVIPGVATVPKGLQAVAALWILGGAGTLFSAFNERELSRRNAELATIRQVTLDIEDSLSLEEIFADLCRGVVGGFGFDAAAVLLREEALMRCVGAHGITGQMGTTLELRGRIAHALATAGPVVTSGEEARVDAGLMALIGPRGYVAVPIAADGLLIATRSGRQGRAAVLRAHEIDALSRLAHHARLAIANARLHARMTEMAVTDSLTGLANHGEMQRRLSIEVGRLERYASLRAAGHHASVILLDIDNFKRFNDRFGHPAGDAALKAVADALRSAVRTFDVIARYGGEEFAVILPETGEQGARDVAERIRAAIGACVFTTSSGGRPARLTASLGIATAPEDGRTPASLIEAADVALYRSKESGRNRVHHASDAKDPVARVLPMDATRRRREPGEGRAPGEGPHARAQSSHPTRRTPRA